ncbi:DNA primase [Rhodobacteraceae bacterium RKSG542]|uniref:DNA primase n=1 Tax=Pseudovibrio flavus TaxID=2529854 RepID=UPI0012BC5E24|nr:DNA primase [Pseudovibrio flavus]MTI19083.1 DNA primase [Pseudovibrio flavus]
MRFSPQFLDEIRNRVTLSDVVARRVSWDRRKSQPGKGDFWACCPFHQEKSPSFHVDDRRNRYKCFGCGESGDHFRFLAETEGLSFPEAVETLANMAGLPMPAPDPQAARKQAKQASLSDICEMAARYFQQSFHGDIGRGAREYCLKRGLRPDTLQEFRFGFAPAGRDNLKQALLKQDIKEADMIEAGLLIKPDDGRPSYDRFRNRLMIPIQDDRGRVVAFGGRTMDPDGQPKYLNSPETPVFHKGTMLFNAHRARQPAFDARQAVVVEGYMDAIAVYQAGIKGVVASLGTAFTEDQIMRMWKFAEEPIICFDGDAAGLSAAYRAVDRILPVLTSGKSFQFALLPDGQDPDDILRAKGLSGFVAELDKALPLSEVLWQREAAQARIDTPERKAALEKALDDLTGSIRDERVKKGYQRDMRVRLSNLFFEESRKGRKPFTPQGGRTGGRSSGERDIFGGQGLGARVDAPETKMFGIERQFCALCLAYPQLFDRHYERISQLHLANELHSGFLAAMCRIATDLASESVAEFYGKLDERFFRILYEVRGPELAREDEKILAAGVRQWGELKHRLPILKLDPPEDFIEHIFMHFIDVLELHRMEEELENEMNNVDENFGEEDWQRIQAMTQDLSRRREECTREEQVLAERARKMRGAKGSFL